MPPSPHAEQNRRAPSHAIEATAPGAASEPTPLQVALRHQWLILVFATLMATAMFVGLRFATPVYVAEAEVRIDMPQLRVVDDNSSLLRSEQPTLELVHTEMAVLNSPRLALRAVQALGLEHEREFQLCPPLSPLQAVGNLLRGPPMPPPPCDVSLEHAVQVLRGALAFSSDRSSFIIRISAAAPDRALAARIANGYANAYIAWQSNLKATLAQQADEWLSADLATMQAKMLADDVAVEAYRQQHHLISLHGGTRNQTGGGTDTVATQRLEQQNTELGGIGAALAEKSSTLAEVQQALHDGQLGAIAPVLGSPLIQSLRARQAELAGNLAQLRANYGPTYPAVAAAEAALARGEGQVRGEADKIVRSLVGEVAALRARRAIIAAQVETAERQVAGESQAAVDLAELQRAAETDRRIYESLFIRLKQVDAERRMGQASAAVVVEALPPDVASYPRTQMMVAGTFLASLGIGVALAFGREMLSRRFRDTEQVEGELGLPVIGIFARCRQAPQDIVIDQPLSVEAEAVHGVLTHLVGRPGADGVPLGRVVMVTSALPGEGKSCFAVALGRSAMRAGMSAFVLDCDLRRPMVDRLIAGGRRDGTVPPPGHDGRDPADLVAEVVRHAGVDERSALRHLSLSDYVSNPHGLMAWPGLAGTLTYLRTRYDLVLLDTPPVLAVADALQLGGLADAVVLAIDWSGTPRQAAVAAARALQRAQLPVTGLVMTKVDLRRYARAHAGAGFYLRHYRGYPRALDDVA